MGDQKIRLKLPNARQKLQPLFPEDNRGDIKINFQKKTFKLQKAFLRLQSGYFKKSFTQQYQTLQIKQNFNEQYFSNVLKCFYGATIQILRSQVFNYFPIIKFLEVQSLLKILRDDMVHKADQYDIFALIQLAHRHDEQDIFEVCLSQLEKEGYEQLRYAKHELFKCPQELFKMIIKTHNRMKSQKGRGIPFIEIDQIIQEFCQDKKLSQNLYQQLKFQLIDKKSLSSQQYKEIFLDEAKRKKTSIEYKSMMKLPESTHTSLYNSSFGNNILAASKLTESVIEPLKKAPDDLTLQMENTFQKKLNEQLKAENIYLMSQLNKLKQSTAENKSLNQSLKETLQILKKNLQEKQRQDKQQKVLINKLDKALSQIKKQLSQKGELIKKLQEKVTKLQKTQKRPVAGNKKYINYDDEEDESRTIQSQIVPGHLLKQIAKPAAEALTGNAPTNAFKKTKKVETQEVQKTIVEEELDEEEIEQLYSDRLQFDIQPTSCPKKYLPKLAKFLYSDGFQKKKLKQIYRRSLTRQKIGERNDLRYRNSLIVLIHTKLNQHIGGFTSASIQSQSSDYLSDQNAFIFSLTKDMKFSIKKSAISEAIFLNSDYLLGFSNDLMIPTDCLKQQAQCSWPSAYENGGGSQKRGPKWLTGQDSSFSIKQVQIFEVQAASMEMIL